MDREHIMEREAVIDDKGTTFSFLDSGRIDGDDYTTIVCLHGHTYNNKTFEKLLEYAPEFNLRVVAPSRRDYKGTTPLTEAELRLLDSEDPADHKQYLRDRGLEIALFLKWIIDHDDVPPYDESAKTASDSESDITIGLAGIALLGWSEGAITAVATVRHLDSYPVELHEALKPYLRTLVLHDVPSDVLGYPRPVNVDFTTFDKLVSERSPNFITSPAPFLYYNHPDLASETLAGLDTKVPPDESLPRSPLLTLSDDKKAEYMDVEAARRSDFQFLDPSRSLTLHEQTRYAIFNPVMAALFCPDLNVIYLYGSKSFYPAVLAAWCLEASFEDTKKAGEQVRRVEIFRMTDANHFYYFDDPEHALMLLQNILEA